MRKSQGKKRSKRKHKHRREISKMTSMKKKK